VVGLTAVVMVPLVVALAALRTPRWYPLLDFAWTEMRVRDKVEVSVVILVLSAFIGLLFSFAEPIAKWLGESGMGVVTRVMGMVLAAIAMGMLADGLKGMLPRLAG
jgi:small neutral amino acid transporter SnatA (MarC family)